MPDSRKCVCLVCGKRSLKLICDQCTRRLRTEALHHTKDEIVTTNGPLSFDELDSDFARQVPRSFLDCRPERAVLGRIA